MHIMQRMQRDMGNLAVLLAMVTAFTLIFSLGLAMASPGVSLGLAADWEAYPAGSQVTGSIELVYDEYIPADAELKAYVDGSLVSSVDIDGMLPDMSGYSFPGHVFSYDLTTSGTNSWKNYSEQYFHYSPNVEGTCGDRDICCNVTESRCWCGCSIALCTDYNSSDPSTIPCDWQKPYPQGWNKDGSVKGTEGLALIYDFTNEFELPISRNDDTVWSETTNSDPGYEYHNPNVTTTMREACGGGFYDGQSVQENGWIRRQLDPSSWDLVDGSHRYRLIGRFDHGSLSSSRDLYTDAEIGGIYKDGEYLPYSETEALDAAFWNGTTGYVKIYFPDSTAYYSMAYLPPNGPKLCAYTNTYTDQTEDWVETKGPFADRRTYYDNPFSYQHEILEFPNAGNPKDCPAYSGDCQQSDVLLGAEITADQSGTVVLDVDQDTLVVTATTSSRQLSDNYTNNISLDGLPGLYASSGTDSVLRVELVYSGQILAFGNATFGSCSDEDSDGHCSTGEGGGDCDDSDGLRNPGNAEVCNGIDDDCDGVTDEGFFVGGNEMGSYCGGAPGTACRGTWRCDPDTGKAVCFQEHEPGDLLEICDNGIDDDCDGEVDEYYVFATGEPDCWCELGKREDCGSNIGICVQGKRICEMAGSGRPEWSECKDSVSPKTEVCNRLDDDCDGVVDNVNSGTSMFSSKCGCYGGLSPTPEVCNEVDDDCDGVVDNGVSCCTDGETRECGTDVGICQKGTQTCSAGSWQGAECAGEVTATGEICYNYLDDDCDGEIDDGCNPEYTCNNGIQDLNEAGIDCGDACPKQCMSGPLWMIIAGVAILVLLVVWLLIMKQKV